MKHILPLLCALCLVVPAAGQTAADPTATDPTVAALTALLPLRDQAKFGAFLKANHERTKFAGFLDTQGRFALLADKRMLLHVKAEADRPNYGGNAAAKTRSNLWLSILQGKVKPAPSPPVAPTD
jgi:hypothetical protein